MRAHARALGKGLLREPRCHTKMLEQLPERRRLHVSRAIRVMSDGNPSFRRIKARAYSAGIADGSGERR